MKTYKNLNGKQITGLNFKGPYTIPVTSSNGVSFSCRASETLKLNPNEIGIQEHVRYNQNMGKNNSIKQE